MALQRGGGPVSPTDLENEETWLRAVIICLRTLLRFAKDTQVEAVLREVITDAETPLSTASRAASD